MATETPFSYPGAPIEVVGAGIDFAADFRSGGVDITIEYPDLGAWASNRTCEKTVTISWEDWDAIVAHVAAINRSGEPS